MKSVRLTVLAVAVAALSSVFFAGCDVGSPNTVERNVAVDYSGIYTGENDGGTIASQNSGAAVKQFDLRQTGASLEAVDNNGGIWKGKITNNPDAENLAATFTLNGKTTANNEVTVSGQISKDAAASTEAQMSGTWIEPAFYAIVSAHGSVSVTSTNTGGNITISPPSATVPVGGNASFTASGASGTITWSVSGGGAVNPVTGNSTTFVRSTAGTVTLTATDASGGSATATIN